MNKLFESVETLSPYNTRYTFAPRTASGETLVVDFTRCESSNSSGDLAHLWHKPILPGCSKRPTITALRSSTRLCVLRASIIASSPTAFGPALAMTILSASAITLPAIYKRIKIRGRPPVESFAPTSGRLGAFVFFRRGYVHGRKHLFNLVNRRNLSAASAVNSNGRKNRPRILAFLSVHNHRFHRPAPLSAFYIARQRAEFKRSGAHCREKPAPVPAHSAPVSAAKGRFFYS